MRKLTEGPVMVSIIAVAGLFCRADPLADDEGLGDAEVANASGKAA